jgi:hypothetical protein
MKNRKNQLYCDGTAWIRIRIQTQIQIQNLIKEETASEPVRILNIWQ